MESVRRVPKVCGIKTYARSPSGCLLLLLLLPPPPPPHRRDFFRSLYTRSCVIYRREAKYVPVGGTLLERNSFNDFFFFFFFFVRALLSFVSKRRVKVVRERRVRFIHSSFVMYF